MVIAQDHHPEPPRDNKKKPHFLRRHWFEIDSRRYRPIKVIGKGAYGVVCSATDVVTNETVAVKKIAGVFENVLDARRTFREIRILRSLRHENIIGVKNVLTPRDADTFGDMYVVYELMDTDLQHIIRSRQPLSDDHCQYFVYQILRGLKYIHSADILHRDLKPGNLLLNANCDLKICDFGLARMGSEKIEKTEYVVTRWYRAPELLLASDHYNTAIDVWSVGCIFAEILARRPFFPGRDYIHQLDLIIDMLGSPVEEDLTFVSSKRARRYLMSLPFQQPQPLSKVLPKAKPLAVDLISRMLVFNPEKRISVDAALRHPYLANLHDPLYEPVAPQPFDLELDEDLLTEDQLRVLLYKESKNFEIHQT